MLVDPDSGQVLRVIAMQYNPDTLTRTLQPQAIASDGQDRSQALRLKGPPVETIKLDAEIDAADQLEFPDQNPNVVQFGIAPQLAQLETLLYPPSARLIANNALQAVGTLEITPVQTPLTLLVWNRQRVIPVRLTDFSITEEAFDPALNPIRAKVSLSLRVLSTDDLGFSTKGGSLFMAYLQSKEQLASKIQPATFATLGIGGIA